MDAVSKIEIALSSKTFWIAAGAVTAAALHALVPFLSGTWLVVIQDVLMVLTLFVAPHDIQKAGRAGQSGSTRY